MEIFLEVVKEIRNGIIRALSAHFFQKTFLNDKKTTPRRDKQKGGSRRKKYFFMTTIACTAEAARGKCS